MNISNFLIIKILAILSFIFIAGCATMSAPGWGDSQIYKIKKGMTSSQIMAIMGEPSRKSISSDGDTWIYKKPSEKHAKTNKFLSIGSIGIFDGGWHDVLQVSFKNDKVTNYIYSEDTIDYLNGMK